MAVRQVTQLNAGKKTAGVDGKASLSFEERLELIEELKAKGSDWKHQKLREIPIPKKDGTTRTLKVPTMADRAWQCLAKYALEPAHEATFHARSYGFRTGRGAHNAQKFLFDNLRSMSNGIEKRVIELDIEKCFDRIAHTAIMERLIAPRGIKSGIFRCLKTGVNPEYPELGTPQGGVITPLTMLQKIFTKVWTQRAGADSEDDIDLLKLDFNLFHQEPKNLPLGCPIHPV